MLANTGWWLWIWVLFAILASGSDEEHQLVEKLFSSEMKDSLPVVSGVCDSQGWISGKKLCLFDSLPQRVELSSQKRQGILQLSDNGNQRVAIAGVLDHRLLWECTTLKLWHTTMPYDVNTHQRLVCAKGGCKGDCSKEICASINPHKRFPGDILDDESYRLPGFNYCKWLEPNTTVCGDVGGCLFYRPVAIPSKKQKHSRNAPYFIWKCEAGTERYSIQHTRFRKDDFLEMIAGAESSGFVSIRFDGGVNYMNGTPLPVPSVYLLSNMELEVAEHDPSAGLPFLLCPPIPFLDSTVSVDFTDCRLAAEPIWHCTQGQSDGRPVLGCYVDGGTNADGQRGLNFDRFVHAKIAVDGRRFYRTREVAHGEPFPPGLLVLDSGSRYWSTSVQIGVHDVRVVADMEIGLLGEHTRFLAQLGLALMVIYATKRIMLTLSNRRHRG